MTTRPRPRYGRARMVAPDIPIRAEGSGRRRALALATLAVALTGCPTVDLGDDPVEPGVCRPSPDYFQTTIWPQYLAQPDQAKTCVGRSGCHAETDGRSALRLDNVEPIDFSRNYQVVTRFLNCGTPGASALLTKPLSGEDPHGGGDMFGPGDPSVTVFEGWFP